MMISGGLNEDGRGVRTLEHFFRRAAALTLARAACLGVRF